MSDKGMKLEESRTQNVLTSKPSSAGKQEEYYAYMLREAKVKNAATLGSISDNEQKALNGISDLDRLELKALARLYKLSDNSPELLQYFAITHCSTREEVAAKLAKKQLRKQLVEEAVNKILSPESVADLVTTTLNSSRTARASGEGFGLGRAAF
jgi:hypothetical protein